MNQALDNAANCAVRNCNCCANMSQCFASGQSCKSEVSTGNRMRKNSTVASRCRNRPEGCSTCLPTGEHFAPARSSASIAAVMVKAAAWVFVSNLVLLGGLWFLV